LIEGLCGQSKTDDARFVRDFKSPFENADVLRVRCATDVVKRPIADYFRGQGAVDLCSASWCNLDYALAEFGTVSNSPSPLDTAISGGACH